MKLHWRLLKTKNLNVPVSTIGKILKQEGLVRKYRKKQEYIIKAIMEKWFMLIQRDYHY